jgi:phosphohistidine phosphatase SixA
MEKTSEWLDNLKRDPEHWYSSPYTRANITTTTTTTTTTTKGVSSIIPSPSNEPV